MGFLFVAAGGALGAMGRYAISLIPVKTSFPILTLVTNIIGAVLIGFIVGVFGDRDDISRNMTLFWKTGICGGFTTFSTFSLEAFTLFENKQIVTGGVYVVLSVVFCVAGIYFGRQLSKVVAM
ncbi:CrcB protein [Butyrivibrio sp. INlla18]|uniref:fluoride efflux transporter CrcB n=1 Tax=Butyrivibrio sp. INlla18 TaxID=1520806 RepID=UPI00088EDD74|nr:CrcB protein [Butyrivibrio sp. INlla18]